MQPRPRRRSDLGPLRIGLLLVALTDLAAGVAAGEGSTRVTDPGMHARSGSSSYPYRAQWQHILKELDLRPSDSVVDIGAGDGWWTVHFAEAVGREGKVHAAEVDERKVEAMTARFRESPQVRPYLCKTDSVELPERSCDLAFFSQSYHHIDLKTRVEYLRRLRGVVKPTGRLVVIEKYSVLPDRRPGHGTNLSLLVDEAEKAGWIPVRVELLIGTYHYLAIFVQADLFPRPPARRDGKRRRVRL